MMLTFLKYLSFLLQEDQGSICLCAFWLNCIFFFNCTCIYVCLKKRTNAWFTRAAPKTGKNRKRECASLGVEGAKSFCEVIPPNASRAVQPSAICVLVVHSCAEAEGGRPLIGLSVRTPSLTTPHTLGLSTIQQLKECTRHTLSYFI